MRVYSTLRVTTGRYEVRVFVGESPTFEYKQLGITKLEIELHRHQDLPMMELAKKILEDKKIKAIEIIDWDKNGIRVER